MSTILITLSSVESEAKTMALDMALAAAVFDLKVEVLLLGEAQRLAMTKEFKVLEFYDIELSNERPDSSPTWEFNY